MKVKLIVQTIIYLWKNLGVHGNYQKLQMINNEGLFFFGSEKFKDGKNKFLSVSIGTVSNTEI